MKKQPAEGSFLAPRVHLGVFLLFPDIPKCFIFSPAAGQVFFGIFQVSGVLFCPPSVPGKPIADSESEFNIVKQSKQTKTSKYSR